MRRSRRTAFGAAAKRGVPLELIDVDDAPARELYARKLVLVRPDQHVAWRGDAEPPDPLGLIDLVRGARAAPLGWLATAYRDDGLTLRMQPVAW